VRRTGKSLLDHLRAYGLHPFVWGFCVYPSCWDPTHNNIPNIHLFFLSATLVTNYEHLLCKFKLLSKECDDLKSKLESNETKTSDSVDLNESSIPCGILSPR
jgi:hypothetical protein